MMAFPREILNELKWRGRSEIVEAEIHYLHRGAPHDIRVMSGAEIQELGRSFFTTADSEVPYHRIKRIIFRGKVIFDAEDPTRQILF